MLALYDTVVKKAQVIETGIDRHDPKLPPILGSRALSMSCPHQYHHRKPQFVQRLACTFADQPILRIVDQRERRKEERENDNHGNEQK
jgi:hypothetical protein